MDKGKTPSAQIRQVSCQNCHDPEPPLIEDHTTGDLICKKCGCVLAERLVDPTAEYRKFSDDGGKAGVDPTRVGGSVNPLLADGGLGTMLGTSSMIGADSAALRWSNSGGMSTDDRVKDNAFKKINSTCENFGFSRKIVDSASQVFSQYYEARGLHFIRARGLDALVAACLYIGCRMAGVPRTFKEICAGVESPKRTIARAYKEVSAVLKSSLSVVTSDQFMERFCSNLNLDHRFATMAAHVAKMAGERGIVGGRSPVSVAAAAIYFVVQLDGKGQQVSVADISRVAGVGIPTVKEVNRILVEFQAYLMPPQPKSDGPSPSQVKEESKSGKGKDK